MFVLKKIENGSPVTAVSNTGLAKSISTKTGEGHSWIQLDKKGNLTLDFLDSSTCAQLHTTRKKKE